MHFRAYAHNGGHTPHGREALDSRKLSTEDSALLGYLISVPQLFLIKRSRRILLFPQCLHVDWCYFDPILEGSEDLIGSGDGDAGSRLMLA